MRVIAATNRDLPEEIRTGNFREDLYYRLSVFQIRLPSLQERPSDIDEYVRHFAGIFAGKMGKKIDAVDPGYLDLMKRHAWRGNVRELRNVVERSMIMAEGTTLRVGDLPIEFQRENGSDGNDAPPTSLDAIEKQHIHTLFLGIRNDGVRASGRVNIDRMPFLTVIIELIQDQFPQIGQSHRQLV